MKYGKNLIIVVVKEIECGVPSLTFPELCSPDYPGGPSPAMPGRIASTHITPHLMCC